MNRRCWRSLRMETWRTGSRCTNTHTDVYSYNNRSIISWAPCTVPCAFALFGFRALYGVQFSPVTYVFMLPLWMHLIVCVCVFQARNKTGHVGYVPEKYLQFPTSNSLLSMLQSLATLDARSHTSSNSTEPELHSNCINGDTNSKYAVNQASGKLFFEMIKLHARSFE